jgi:hypothetical protein
MLIENAEVPVMAQKTIVQLVDDLDGTASDSVETVAFGLDGVPYEIDLNEDNASNLRDVLAVFVGAAKRTGGRLKRGLASTPASGRSREETQVIRDWAKDNNWEIADRGRIPHDIIEAFEAAQTSKKRKSK